MWPPAPAELARLLDSLFETPILHDRIRDRDHRPAALRQITSLGDGRAVPTLMFLLSEDDAIAPHVAVAISTLVRRLTAPQLAWIDAGMRRMYHPAGAPLPRLSVGRVRTLTRLPEVDNAVLGVISSHPNGWVREAAMAALVQQPSDSLELSFLALRANDWVEPIAHKATRLLLARLTPDNRAAVFDALPLIVRLLGQRRRDHRQIELALTAVLLSDGGAAALAHSGRLDTITRRVMFRLLMSVPAWASADFLKSALRDADVVIRAKAMRAIVQDPAFPDRGVVLERLLHDDPVPALRGRVLSALDDHLPERIPALFPDVLFDRAVSVRSLSRFIAKTRQLPVVARDLYASGLDRELSRRAVAIAGLGETGSTDDADLVMPFLAAPEPRLRRAALRALVNLDSGRAVEGALSALADDSASVRNAAVDVLMARAGDVDFDSIARLVRGFPDPAIRRSLLRLFWYAPKWDAIALLLETLGDPDASVHASVPTLIDEWVMRFNRAQTQPSSGQLERLRMLLDIYAGRISSESETMIRLSVKTN